MFYNYPQNNSGGYLVPPAQEIIIEADSAEEANRIFYDLDLDHVFCSCCGERWYPCWDNEGGTETPQLSGKDATVPPVPFWEFYREQPPVAIYYRNGEIAITNWAEESRK